VSPAPRKKAYSSALAAVVGERAPEPEPDFTASEPEPEPAAPVKARPVRKSNASPFRPYVPPVEEETAQLNVRIPKALLARVKALHKATDEPMKSLVERALEALCENEENR
jgi:hypothetical protein